MCIRERERQREMGGGYVMVNWGVSGEKQAKKVKKEKEGKSELEDRSRRRWPFVSLD